MRISLAAALAAGVLLASAPAGAQQPIVIKFSHVVTPDTPKGKGAREIQGARGEIHERPRQGRSLPELAAL